jgi:hypothetical protein
VWTTYHFLAILILILSKQRSDPGNNPGKNNVHKIQIKTKEKSSNKHNEGGAINLIFRRPRHLFHLGPDFFQKRKEALVPFYFFTHSLTFFFGVNMRFPVLYRYFNLNL